MDIAQFKILPIMGILRGIEACAIRPLTEVISSSGLKTVEIAMNTPSAEKLIKQMVDEAEGRFTVGAGTVLDMQDLRSALCAGAEFIVSPVLAPSVAEYCRKNNVPAFFGALTPQEIYNASRAGASMVKVFPAKFFGPGYFKEIKGPFNNIELLACGGVTAGNIKSFFEAGASAVAFGSSIFNKDMIAERNYSGIGELIKALVNEVESIRKDEK